MKNARVHHRRFATRAEAIAALTEWLELFYDRPRRQARLGYLSPAAYARQFYRNRRAAQSLASTIANRPQGLPVVWFLVLGWAGHHLAASGLAGGLSEGLGKAAGGGVRAGTTLAKGAVRFDMAIRKKNDGVDAFSGRAATIAIYGNHERGPMHKTTLYIEDDIALALRHRAGVDGKSQAEHIREALRRYVRDLERSDGEPSALPPGAGSFRSGRSDVSTQAETLLREAARKKT